MELLTKGQRRLLFLSVPFYVAWIVLLWAQYDAAVHKESMAGFASVLIIYTFYLPYSILYFLTCLAYSIKTGFSALTFLLFLYTLLLGFLPFLIFGF